MAQVTIKELLEAGVHFGHQTRRWNPKMRRYIFGERGGIHIIDLQKTERLLAQAQEFAAEIAGRGGTVLFVGTKKQARDTVAEAAQAAEPAQMDIRHAGRLGRLLDRVARLLLGADEQDRAAAAGEVGRELLRRREQTLGLLEIDDVDSVPLAEDVAAHLRVPAPGLVAEVDAGLQQFPHGHD